MRGFASMLPLSGLLNQKQTEALKRINDGIEHISQMTERLTYLSRLTFGEEAELDYNLADMQELLTEVAARHTPAAEDQEIELSVEAQPDLPLVLLDGMLYGQAVQNLVQNALKYTPEGGRIQVRAYLEDGGTELTICVSDTGMGIRPEDQARLFEAFYRVPHREGDPPRPKGSGIGLALVKAIAQAHGGEVRVESKWEEGSSFFISIPVRRAKDLKRT
jgi:signal transduction histidine kinase